MTSAMIEQAAQGRINGLIAEDRIRTTNMFVRGNIAFHPTDPIDISPEADLIHGLPTHVKITKRTYSAKTGKPNALNIDMACAYRLFLLEGNHRLLIMVYEEEKGHDDEGRPRKILRFDEIIEIILTDETLKAFRNDITVYEMGRLRDLLLSWDPVFENAEQAEIEANKARAQYHPMTEAMRSRQGIAHPSIKISINKKTLKIDNKRIQATISVEETEKQVMSEGEGSLKGFYIGKGGRQARYIVHRSSFHGLDMPWRTTAHWKKLPRTGAITPKPREKKIQTDNRPYSSYIRQWKDSGTVSIPHGTLVYMTHDDDKVTIHIDTRDAKMKAHAERVCRYMGGEWIEEISSWLMTSEQGRRVFRTLKPRVIPEFPENKTLRPSPKANNVFNFPTEDGRVSLLPFGKGGWLFRPDEKNEDKWKKIDLRISSMMIACGIGKTNRHPVTGQENWFVDTDGIDKAFQVVSAIQAFNFLDHNP